MDDIFFRIIDNGNIEKFNTIESESNNIDEFSKLENTDDKEGQTASEHNSEKSVLEIPN